jgi:hypothetical protein
MFLRRYCSPSYLPIQTMCAASNLANTAAGNRIRPDGENQHWQCALVPARHEFHHARVNEKPGEISLTISRLCGAFVRVDVTSIANAA